MFQKKKHEIVVDRAVNCGKLVFTNDDTEEKDIIKLNVELKLEYEYERAIVNGPPEDCSPGYFQVYFISTKVTTPGSFYGMDIDLTRDETENIEQDIYDSMFEKDDD